MSVEQIAKDALRTWRADAVRFVRDQFHVEPDAWQAAALRAWSTNSPRFRLAMQACAGPGKSAVLAWCGWHALACFSDGEHHPNGYATSIDGTNLATGLWKELALWRDQSRYLTAAFDMTSEAIRQRQFPQTWFLVARTFPKTADPEAQGRVLSGLHSPFIFYLIDESGDMAPSVGRSAEQGLGNCRWGRIAQAGNPTNSQGLLHQSVTEGAHLWHVVRITGDPDDPHRSPRIPLEWAREQIQLYTRDNPWVQAFILGQFPPGAFNALLTTDEVRDAMARHLDAPQYDWSQKRLGVDCARFGDDRTVLFPRQGLAAFSPTELRGKRGPEIAAQILKLEADWQHELTLLDATGGWGQSTEDALYTAGRSPIAVQFHAPALDPRYANRRAEMWWDMAEWVKRGGALPNLPMLVAELTTPSYTFQGGKLLIEPKEQVKKRLGRSPDLADALALTFALPDMPAAFAAAPGGLMAGFANQAGHALSDYNPWET